MANDDILVWQYAGCGTCKKALRLLDANHIAYRSIPIVESPPSLAELKKLVADSGKPVRKFVNVSGGSYRALVEARGKDAVAAMSDDELLRLLAADGKMIKRPVLRAGSKVLVGFDEAEYRSLGT